MVSKGKKVCSWEGCRKEACIKGRCLTHSEEIPEKLEIPHYVIKTTVTKYYNIYANSEEEAIKEAKRLDRTKKEKTQTRWEVI